MRRSPATTRELASPTNALAVRAVADRRGPARTVVDDPRHFDRRLRELLADGFHTGNRHAVHVDEYGRPVSSATVAGVPPTATALLHSRAGRANALRPPQLPSWTAAAGSESLPSMQGDRCGGAPAERCSSRIAIARLAVGGARTPLLSFVRLSSERAREAVRQECSVAKKGESSPCAPRRRPVRADGSPSGLLLLLSSKSSGRTVSRSGRASRSRAGRLCARRVSWGNPTTLYCLERVDAGSPVLRHLYLGTEERPPQRPVLPAPAEASSSLTASFGRCDFGSPRRPTRSGSGP